jgi:transcriptional regulator with XRE-family HTH domain
MVVALETAAERAAYNQLLGKRLGELRTRAGLSQAEVARRLGVDSSIPSLWEQGKRALPPHRLPGLADALGLREDQLMAGLAVDAQADALDEDQLLADGAEPNDEPDAPLPAASATLSTLDGPAPPRTAGTIALDPLRAQLPRMRAVVLARLCEAGRTELRPESEVSIARLVEESSAVCAAEPSFLRTELPLLERVFRLVLCRGGGPVATEDMAESLAVAPSLLRRLGPTARASYPLTWRPG